MLQTIATIFALVIGLAALIFTLTIFYKIFLANRPKKEKVAKVSKKQAKQQAKEAEEAKDYFKDDSEPEIKLFATENRKVTGFELDDED